MKLLTPSTSRGAVELEKRKLSSASKGVTNPLEVPYGVVYTWHPEDVLVECGCGKTLTYDSSASANTATVSDAQAIEKGSTVQEGRGRCVKPWPSLLVFT